MSEIDSAAEHQRAAHAAFAHWAEVRRQMQEHFANEPRTLLDVQICDMHAKHLIYGGQIGEYYDWVQRFLETEP